MIYAFGDSYAAYSSYVFQGRDAVEGIDSSLEPDLEIKKTMSWIDYLSDHTGQKVGHLGTPGRGPLDLVEQFYKFLKSNDVNENDILIFCWSRKDREMDKWGDPYLDPEFDNTRFDNENDIMKYKQAVSLYYLYLHSEEQCLQMSNSSYLAVDGLLEKLPCKNVFHFYCFRSEIKERNQNKLHIPKNGIVTDEWSLYSHAHSFDDYGENGIDDMEYPNHYSPKGSIGLANYIYEKIIN
jgi:hypothetical protein